MTDTLVGSVDVRRRFTVTGVVQGVGFRPFVHRIASELGLTGFVGNDSGAVFLEVQGPGARIDEFHRRLRAEAPPLAAISAVQSSTSSAERMCDSIFRIVESQTVAGATTPIPPDIAVCDDCIAELFDPNDRRYRHPFVTCTNCGPRFTIIRALPYDRPATTMSAFTMCERCAAEYHDPANRRFHAQPIACPDCGPSLWFASDPDRVDGSDAALGATQQALAAGAVVAIKGIGGYHLACRVDDDAVVAALRTRKARGAKPLAMLVRDLDVARRYAHVDDTEAAVLSSAGPADRVAAAPSGCAGRRRRRTRQPAGRADAALLADPSLTACARPGCRSTSTRCPGADQRKPLRRSHLLHRRRCCATSSATVRRGARPRPAHPCALRRLGGARGQRPDGRELPIRRSRGYAPLPVDLGRDGPPVLAVGGELKNTFCLTDGARAYLSGHIGDMQTLETLRAFERAVGQLSEIRRQPVRLAADLHPGYHTRSWAERRAGDRPLDLVQHHHAHVVSLLAEHGRIGEPIIGVSFDGTGYGCDQTIWGGEILKLGRDSHRFVRAAHLLPVPQPGGDAAVRNPWRMALSELWMAGIDWTPDLPPVTAATRGELRLIRSQLECGTGCVPCSSMGRLFDAVASLLGLRHQIDYEGQAAIELEALADSIGDTAGPKLRLAVRPDGVIDPAGMLRTMVAALRAGVQPAVLAAEFHQAIAVAVVEAVEMVAGPVRLVGLTGGVFQNVLLLQGCRQRLQQAGFEVLTHHTVPPNDGGLALGQAAISVLTALEEG